MAQRMTMLYGFNSPEFFDRRLFENFIDLLHARGVFSSNEWAVTLGGEIKKAQAAGDPDTGETYYHHWLAALERLVAAKGLADARALARNREAWRRASARTPHGTPLALRPSDFDD